MKAQKIHCMAFVCTGFTSGHSFKCDSTITLKNVNRHKEKRAQQRIVASPRTFTAEKFNTVHSQFVFVDARWTIPQDTVYVHICWHTQKEWHEKQHQNVWIQAQTLVHYSKNKFVPLFLSGQTLNQWNTQMHKYLRTIVSFWFAWEKKRGGKLKEDFVDKHWNQPWEICLWKSEE